MIRLEDQNRVLKQKVNNLKKLKGDEFEYNESGYGNLKHGSPKDSKYSNDDHRSIDSKVEKLTKEAMIHQKRSQKDEKLLQMQKKLFDKHVLAQNKVIKQHEQSIKEKDKELRMQALKIKELMTAGTDAQRNKIIRKDFQLLQSLAQASSPNRHQDVSDPQKRIILD